MPHRLLVRLATGALCLGACLAAPVTSTQDDGSASAADVQPAQEGPDREALDVSVVGRIELHESEKVRGLLRLPYRAHPEPISIVMEVAGAPSDHPEMSLALLKFFDMSLAWERLTTVPVDKVCGFSLPRIVTAPANMFVRIRVEGRFHYADDVVYVVDGEGDPGDSLEIHGAVGGHLTVKLNLPADATQEERAALVGRAIVLEGADERRASGEIFTQPHRYSATLDEALSVSFGGVRYVKLDYAHAEMPDEMPGELSESLAPFYLGRRPRIFVGADEEQVVEYHLVRGKALRGVVLDEEGRPVEGAWVQAVPSVGRALRYLESAASTGGIAEQDGTFEMVGLSPDTDRLVITIEGFLGEEFHGRDLDPFTQDVGGVVVLTRGSTARGRVIFPGGQPAAETYVRFETDASGPGWAPPGARTDDHGYFEASGFRNGSLRITVDGWRSDRQTSLAARAPSKRRGGEAERSPSLRMVAAAVAEFADTAAMEPVLLELRAAPILRGRIVDPAGANLGAGRLKLRRRRHGATSFESAASLPFDPSSGEFTIGDALPWGQFEIWAEASKGKKPRSTPRVLLNAHELPDELVLTYEVLSSVQGRVLDPDGNPVPRATVLVAKKDKYYDRSWREARTDAAGAFTLPDIPEAEYTLTLKHVDYLIEHPFEFRVPAPNEPAAELDVRVVAGGRVMLERDWSDEAQRWSSKESLRKADGSLVRIANGARYVTRPYQTIGPVLPGRYTVAVHWTHDLTGSQLRSERTVEVHAGEATRVTLGLDAARRFEVEGVVQDRMGQPIDGYRVEARQGGVLGASARTDHRGQYRLQLQNEGAFELTLRSPVSTRVLRQSSLVLLDTDEGCPRTVDWTLGTSSISGSIAVVDPTFWQAGIRIELVPKGEDLTRHDRDRSVDMRMGSSRPSTGQPRQARFEFGNLEPGTYTLIGWRPSPTDDPRDRSARSERATEPLEVTVGSGEEREGLILKLLAPAGGD